MKVLVLFALVAVAVAQDASAAASAVRHTPQQQWLAKQAVANFGCRVDEVTVSTENPGQFDTVKAADLRTAFANVASLEWSHVPQMFFASFDGRNEEKVLGTPGGDMGEFIQAIHAYSQVSGQTLNVEDVTALLEKYLRVMTREKFFYETDEKAYLRLAIATGCRNLHVTEMGGMRRKRETYLEEITKPEHIGDVFIKFLVTNATDLSMNPDYIHAGLAAFHNVLWSTPSPLSDKLCYFEMKGAHKEAALVNIKVPQWCTDQGLAPMVSQQLACPAPVFINHVDSVKLLRRDLVSALTEGTQVDASEVLATYNTMAEQNLDKFWSGYGEDLPIYTVEFGNSSPLFSVGGQDDE